MRHNFAPFFTDFSLFASYPPRCVSEKRDRYLYIYLQINDLERMSAILSGENWLAQPLP